MGGENGSKAASRAATALLYAGNAVFTALIAFFALVDTVFNAAILMESFEGL